MKVVHTPGKQMYVADCLSRAQLAETEEISERTRVIHSVTKKVCCSEENYNLYKSILSKEEKLKRICEYVVNGWPGYHKLDNYGQTFHKYKTKLDFENGLLFKDH